MADETTSPVEGEQEQLDMTGLLAQLEALTASHAALQAQLAAQAAPPETPEAEPVPPPAPPPEPVGRITRQQYDAMSAYAAQQAQAAERHRLAAEHGLQPGELDGEFGSPQAMQQYAELLALRKSVQALEQGLQASLEPPSPPEPLGEEEEPPPGDLGGPTGTQSPEQVARTAQYEAARALGRTVAGRQATLQAIFSDPDKQSPVRQR